MVKPDLHVVSFSVPFPATYGGAIDVWQRIKALSAQGVKINLHCFLYGSGRLQPAINAEVDHVHYYPRVVWPALFSKGQPYIVTSRKSKELLSNLQKDNAPILFEGMHTTGFALALSKRNLMLRAHNIEHQYYEELAANSKGIKSLIFRREAICLRAYEAGMAKHFNTVFPISPSDTAWFVEQQANAVFIPPFHGAHEVTTSAGRGSYILYQGDLSIEINQIALFDMLQMVSGDPAYPIVVAGRSGDKAFEEKVKAFPNIQRKADVSSNEMKTLIQEAQLIIIHSLHGSGMKLKMFPALYHGRFVLATTSCKTYTPVDEAIQFYNPALLKEQVLKFWPLAFTASNLEERKQILGRQPNDLEKAKEILRYL